MASSSRSVGAGEAAVARPVFRKGLGRLTALVLINGLFEVLSLGLFRFWSRTRLRRFYWNHAVIDGTPLEYDGRGRELLSGFLRALGLLLVPGAVIFVGAVVLMGVEAVLGPADLAFMVILLPLIPVGLYTARGYRLSRTYWRGIGFHQDGSARRYALLWMFWLMVCAATLGLAVPWRNVATQRYRVVHTMYGDMRFAFTGRGRGLIAAWIVPWLCGAGAAITIVMAEMGADTVRQAWAFSPLEAAFGLSFAFIVLFIHYRTVEFRYFARHTALGPVRFRSRLGSAAVLALVLPHLAIAMVPFGLMVGLAMKLPRPQPQAAVMTADMALFLALLLASALVLTMLVSLSYNLLVRYGLLRQVCRSLEVENLGGLADAAPAHAPRPRRGEGFAENFDLAGL